MYIQLCLTVANVRFSLSFSRTSDVHMWTTSRQGMEFIYAHDGMQCSVAVGICMAMI